MTRLAIGIDVGGTKMLGVVIDPADPGTVLMSVQRPTPPPSSTSVDPTGSAALVDALASLVDALGAPGATVGLGLPGLVRTDGSFVYGPNLPGVVEAAVGPVLGAASGRHVVVDNDANNAARAEFAIGAGASHADGVLVTMGTGIGAGVVVAGRVRRGANGFAGEPGHTIVVVDGEPCPCGRRGCWERYASGSALGRLGREAARENAETAMLGAAGAVEQIMGEHVVAAARAGDPTAVAVVDEFAGWVALGLSNLVATLDTGIVVLGGGVIAAADLLMDRIRTQTVDRCFGAARRPPVEVVAAQLGPSAGAVGAALSTVEPV